MDIVVHTVILVPKRRKQENQELKVIFGSSHLEFLELCLCLGHSSYLLGAKKCIENGRDPVCGITHPSCGHCFPGMVA